MCLGWSIKGKVGSSERQTVPGEGGEFEKILVFFKLILIIVLLNCPLMPPITPSSYSWALLIIAI